MTDERMRRRALIGTVVLAVIAAGVTVVALASRSSAPSGQRPSSASASPPAPSATARPSPCTPARVHYAGPPAAAHALDEGLIPENVPWIASPDSAVYGFLFFQEAPEFERLYSRRPRVATIPTNGQVTDGVNAKILWWLRDAGQSDDLVVLVGRRIDAAGQFEQELGTSSVLPSIVDIPTAGCWTLTIRRGAASWNLRVKAIDSR